MKKKTQRIIEQEFGKREESWPIGLEEESSLDDERWTERTPDSVESSRGKWKINKEWNQKDSGWSACVECWIAPCSSNTIIMSAFLWAHMMSKSFPEEKGEGVFDFPVLVSI